jgi:hypothetical protein
MVITVTGAPVKLRFADELVLAVLSSPQAVNASSRPALAVMTVKPDLIRMVFRSL